MREEKLEELRDLALSVGHRTTGHAWTARDDTPDRQGVFDAEDYVVIGVDRSKSRHYEKEDHFGDPELHRYIAALDPGTVLDLLRDLNGLEAEKSDLEAHVAELDDELKGWESWEPVALNELAMQHINRRVQIRLRSTDRLVGTLTHIEVGRTGSPFGSAADLNLTAKVLVAGQTVVVHLREGDLVTLGPYPDTD